MNSRIATLSALAGLGASALAQSLTTIAFTGQPAPLEPGVVFARPSPPALGEGGAVVFYATLAGDGLSADLDEGVFFHLNGGVSLVVRESDPAPWYAPDVRFVGLSDFAIDSSGAVVLAASVDDPAVSDPRTKARSLGIFAEVGAQTFAPLARTDDQAAGLPDGDLYETLNSPAVSPNGQSYFTGGRPDDGFDSYAKGLWTDRSGATALLLAPGDPAPGVTGSVFANVETPTPGPGGGYALRGSFRPEGTSDPARQGLWREFHGSLSALALAGDAAPGTGDAFTGFGGATSLNTASSAAFWASLDSADPGVAGGVWSDRSGALGLVLRHGDAAPGIAGATVRAIGPRARLNDAGDIALLAALDGAGESANGAVYLAHADGSFTLVAREGDALPDQSGEVRIAGLGEPVLNGAGHVVLGAHLAGAGVTPTTNDALLARDTDGTVSTLVREGDSIDPDGSGPRTVKGIFIDTSGPSRPALDSVGRVGFALSFTDGSFGAFVAQIGYASPADYDGDGDVDTHDFIVFLNAWASGDPSADFNGDGDINTADFTAFLNVWVRDRG